MLPYAYAFQSTFVPKASYDPNAFKQPKYDDMYFQILYSISAHPTSYKILVSYIQKKPKFTPLGTNDMLGTFVYSQIAILCNWLGVRNPSTPLFNIHWVFIKCLKPLDDATDQEAPRAPESCETTLIYGSGVRSSESKSAAKREAYTLCLGQYDGGVWQ